MILATGLASILAWRIWLGLASALATGLASGLASGLATGLASDTGNDAGNTELAQTDSHTAHWQSHRHRPRWAGNDADNKNWQAPCWQ